jgi:hypothetical protein
MPARPEALDGGSWPRAAEAAGKSRPSPLIPAQAGIQFFLRKMTDRAASNAGENKHLTRRLKISSFLRADWVPAFAGTSG